MGDGGGCGILGGEGGWEGMRVGCDCAWWGRRHVPVWGECVVEGGEGST